MTAVDGETSKGGRSQRMLQTQVVSATSANVIGVVLNVVVDAAVLAYFGLGSLMDAYFAALTIPVVAKTSAFLLASRVVQPTFIYVREHESLGAAWRFLNAAGTVGIAAMIGLGCIVLVAAPGVIGLQIPGADDATIATATGLLPPLFFLMVLLVPIALMRATLNSLGVFFLPGLDTSIEASAKGMAVLLVGATIGVYALVWGLYLAALVQAALYYRALRTKGYRARLVVARREPYLAATGSAMRYPLAGQVTGVLVDFTSSVLVSFCGTGAIAAYGLASRIVTTLARSLGHGIVLTASPTLARSLSIGRPDEAMMHLGHAIKLLLLVTVPLSAWLVVMREPAISLVYERMNFTHSDVTFVAGLLLACVPYVLLSRLVGLFELPFFGRRETRPPFVGSVVVATTYVAVSVALFQVLEIYAVPVARSVALAAGATLLFVLIKREFPAFTLGDLATWCSRLALVTAAMVGVLVVGRRWLEADLGADFWSKLALVLLPSLFGAMVLGAGVVVFGLLERKSHVVWPWRVAKSRT